MKKLIFIISISLYSVLIIFLSSKFYLIGGSDVIDFVYSISTFGKVTVIIGLFTFGYMAFFTKKHNIFYRLMFILVFFLSFVSSQSVVYSGKNNVIEYCIYGYCVDKIDINPTKGEKIVLDLKNPGLVTISNKDMSLTYISLFYPFCLNTSEIKNL